MNQTIRYELNLNNVEKLVEFLNGYSLSEKRYLRASRGIPEETGEDLAREMDFVEIDKTNFLNFFTKYQDKKILVLFHTKNKIKMSIKKYLFEAHGYFLNVFFDCKGEKDFCLKTFGVSTFPSLRLFNENTFDASLPTFGHFFNYTEFSSVLNTTFIEDFNKYVSKNSTIINSTEFDFKATLTDAKERNKIVLLSIQDEEAQEVSLYFYK